MKKCCLIFLFSLFLFSCVSEKGEHPYLHFVNQSDEKVWAEVNPKNKLSISDTLFYCGSRFFLTNPKDTFLFEPTLGWHYWTTEFELYNSFVRIFVCDKIYLGHPVDADSLLKFQQEHVIAKGWFTHEDLDALDWTVVYPDDFY